MKPQPTNHLPVLVLVAALLGIPTTGVVFSPTLYRIFRVYSGYDGMAKRVAGPPVAAAPASQKITVQFDANVARGLPWDFTPAQRSLQIRFGEPTKVYYHARNNSDQTLVGRAVFNVTPYQAASYFFKIHSFALTNEKLGPGESADMPLVFYVDKQMLMDKNAKDVQNITLSYTFYRQDGLSPGEIAATRDLGAASRQEDVELKSPRTIASYRNDAPRQ